MICPIEDRIALADLVSAFGLAVDDIGNSAGVAALFTADAVYDLSAMGAAPIAGRDGIAAFFDGAFATMAQNMHLVGNVLVTAHDGADAASLTAYCHAFSLGRDGSQMEVKVRYAIDAARNGGQWRIARLGLSMLLPSLVSSCSSPRPS
jgi:uncharacterized protein (TIGR02246 family)